MHSLYTACTTLPPSSPPFLLSLQTLEIILESDVIFCQLFHAGEKCQPLRTLGAPLGALMGLLELPLLLLCSLLILNLRFGEF